MKTLCIAGGAGFIGFYCANYFARQGYEINIIDNLSRGQLLNQEMPESYFDVEEKIRDQQNIHFYELDLRNFEEIKSIIGLSNAIIDAAGQTAVTTSLIDPRTDFENNFLTTFNILEAIRSSRKKIPFIYCSTNKVFGNNIDKIPLKEENTHYSFPLEYEQGIPETFPVDLCAHTPYGASKLAADLYVQEYGKTYGIPTAVFRMSCIYGPHQYGTVDQGWVQFIVGQIARDEHVTIFGDGKQVRDILHVADLVIAFQSFLTHFESIGTSVFCMGGGPGNVISLLELIDIFEEKLHKKVNVEFQDWRPADQKVYISNILKAKVILDWEPQISAEAGILELYTEILKY